MREFYFGSWTRRYQYALYWLLLPFVPLYKLARTVDQTIQLRRRRALERPVISVGNLSLGGTGKTSFVLWLLETLQGMGCNPAVLKRGQGAGEGVVIKSEPVDARKLGDEAALIHHRFPRVPLGVGSDRWTRGKEILRRGDVDCFVLDDGFQHRRLGRDIDIVLIGDEREIERGELPAGPLREPVSALRRADFVSLKTTGTSHRTDQPSRVLASLDIPEPRQLRHGYRFEGIWQGEREITERCRSRPVELWTTLARPRDLRETLRNEGIRVKRHRSFPDHDALLDQSPSRCDVLPTVMTEKEWIKLSPNEREQVGVIRSRFVVHHDHHLKKSLRTLVESK